MTHEPHVGQAVGGGEAASSERRVEAVEALIVVDMQTAFVSGDGAVPDAARLLANTTELLDRARAAGTVVVHLQNDGPPGADDEPHTAGWELYLPVNPGPTEHVIRKPKDDGFDGTSLGDVLARAGVRSMAICGVMSEMCVQATARTALARGFHVVVPHDAHATYDIAPAAGIHPEVPAHTVSRVAAWALGDKAETTTPTKAVTFTIPTI